MPPKSRPPSRLKKHHLVLTKDAESSRRRSIQMLAARKGPPENEGPASRSSRNGVSRAVEDSWLVSIAMFLDSSWPGGPNSLFRINPFYTYLSAPRRTLTSSRDDFNPCLLRLEVTTDWTFSSSSRHFVSVLMILPCRKHRRVSEMSLKLSWNSPPTFAMMSIL
jgi:hypothetical protein